MQNSEIIQTLADALAKIIEEASASPRATIDDLAEIAADAIRETAPHIVLIRPANENHRR